MLNLIENSHSKNWSGYYTEVCTYPELVGNVSFGQQLSNQINHEYLFSIYAITISLITPSISINYLSSGSCCSHEIIHNFYSSSHPTWYSFQFSGCELFIPPTKSKCLSKSKLTCSLYDQESTE